MEHKELSQKDLEKLKLDEWLKSNVSTIWELMDDVRRRKYSEVADAHTIPGIGPLARSFAPGSIGDFSPHKRLPSEMAVCETWRKLKDEDIKLPEGYDVGVGHVDFGSKDRLNHGISHQFLLNKQNGEIVDLCVGQFVHPNGLFKKVKPGDRLKELQDKASDLFKTVHVPGKPIEPANSVTFLVGQVVDIQQRIGLHYRVNTTK